MLGGIWLGESVLAAGRVTRVWRLTSHISRRFEIIVRWFDTIVAALERQIYAIKEPWGDAGMNMADCACRTEGSSLRPISALWRWYGSSLRKFDTMLASFMRKIRDGTVLAVFGLMICAAAPAQKGINDIVERSENQQIELHKPVKADSLRNDDTLLDGGCKRGEERRSSDLCAQWKAADAAKEAAYWTGETFWLGVGGLAVGFLTLGAACAAAYFAKVAGDSAKKALINSEMPYLAVNLMGSTFSPAHDSEKGSGDLWQITLVNYGNFPAKLTQIELCSNHNSNNDFEPAAGNGLIKLFPDGFIIPPSGEFHIQRYKIEEYDPQISLAIMNGQSIVWLIGLVRYKNLWGDNFITRFSLTYDSERKEVVMRGVHNGSRQEKTNIPVPTEMALARNPYIA